MKNSATIVMLSLLLVTFTLRAQVAINADGSQANAHAILDVKSNDKGMLIPRMTTAERTSLGQNLTASEKGMLVFDTETNSLFYWNSAAWTEMAAQNYWKTNGNSVSLMDTNFIGTINNMPLKIFTDNTLHLRITTKGQLETMNTGGSVFIGRSAGNNDITTDDYTSIYIGDSAGYSGAGFARNNIAIGKKALYGSTGGKNIAIGNNTLMYSTHSARNIAIGFEAIKNLNNNHSAAWYDNIAIGTQTLYNFDPNSSFSPGRTNTAIGSYSMYSLTEDGNNTALGYSTLYNNKNGYNNIAIGVGAISADTISIGNIAIGNNAIGEGNQTIANIAIGTESLLQASGNHNIAIGLQALYHVSEYDNLAIGETSLFATTDGLYNIGIGKSTLKNNVHGNANTALGYEAGLACLGSKNIFIGFQAGKNETGNNKLYIDNSSSNFPLIGGDFTANTVDINGSLTADNLIVSNTITIQSGSPGINKFLISDAVGLASWHTPGLDEMSDAVTDASSLFLGNNAGATDDGANNNTAVGVSSLTSNVSGIANTALGYQSGNQSTGNGNIFLGYQAGYYETGNDKLYIANSNTTTPLIGGDFNTAEVDINGTLKITGGSPGVNKVLTSDVSGMASWQTTQGAQEINDLSDAKTTISSCVFLGTGSGASISSGTGNSAIGVEALNAVSGGSQNTAQGYRALCQNASGDHNTVIGFNAFNTATACSNNTALGYYAGFLTSGSGNVFLGYQSGYNETGSNKLYIANSDTNAPLIGGDFSIGQVDINGTVKITGGNPDAGKMLTSDANGLASWETAPVGADGSIDTHSNVDVTTTPPVSGQVLNWDGVNWMPADDANTTYTAGTGLALAGTVFSLNSGIDNLTDVDVSTNAPTGGQVLSWNGTNWAPADDSLGALAINDLSDAINDSSSLFLGAGAGINDDASSNLNVGVGTSALTSNTNGNENTAIGAEALYNNISGINNTAVGRSAGLHSTGSGNVFIGYRAGTSETGSNKLYVANSATTSPLIYGDFSTSLVEINGTISITGGSPGAGKVLTSDIVGHASWQTPVAPAMGGINDLTDGYTTGNSVFLGEFAGMSNGTLMGNTGTGNSTLSSNSSGINNTAFGAGALAGLTSGNDNTAIGYLSGTYDIAGNMVNNMVSNIFIGSYTKASASADTNMVVIGRFAEGLGSNSVVIGNSDIEKNAFYGKVGIGITDPKSTLQVNGGVQVANDSDIASVDKVGTIRYRADANNSYVEMCVQTGASTYAWIVIHQETW